MTINKRERTIGIVAGAVVGLLLLDQVLITPLLARWTDADDKIELATLDRNSAEDLIFASERANGQWSRMIGTQLHRDASEAESQVLNSVREWAQEAGMNLSSVKPERTEKEKDFFKITFRATGSGGMAQVGRFLWRLETASVPVRVTDVTITSRKPGTDDLGVQLGIATSYLAPETVDKLPRATTGSVSRRVER
jgi:hypothetical protein